MEILDGLKNFIIFLGVSFFAALIIIDIIRFIYAQLSKPFGKSVLFSWVVCSFFAVVGSFIYHIPKEKIIGINENDFIFYFMWYFVYNIPTTALILVFVMKNYLK